MKLKTLTPIVPRFDPVEPTVFRKKRLAARRALATLEPPSDKKYTNWERYKVAERFIDKAVGGVAPNLTIHQDDYDTGFKTIAIPLTKAIADWPEQVTPYLHDVLPPARHYFAAMSGTLYQEGAVVVVPKHTKADIIAEFSAEPGKLNAYRNIIIAGEGSEVTYTEINALPSSSRANHTLSSRAERSGAEGSLSGGRKRDSSTRLRLGRNDKGVSQLGQDEETIVVQGTEVYVDQNAKLEYYNLQQWPEAVTALSAYRGRVNRDAKLDWLIGSFGAGLSQVDVESELDGEGAETNVRAVYYGNANQHFDQTLTAFHKTGHTTSDTYARGIVTDSARAVYRGMIRIAPGAHGSSADQNGHGMLLTDTSHADMIPGLEIDADDVTAGHGATVGQIDAEQLFYLMARGIPEAEARDLIIHGFFEHLFGRIKREAVRERFWVAVQAKA